MVYQIPKLFPSPSMKNLVICVSANYKDGSVLLADQIPDLHFNGDTQAFSLYYYEERIKNTPTLFDEPGGDEYISRDGVSDFILDRAKKQYRKNVTKEDVFYYVYGVLHSPDYRTAFANDLKKMPHIVGHGSALSTSMMTKEG
jgi:predicted helicase